MPIPCRTVADSLRPPPADGHVGPSHVGTGNTIFVSHLSCFATTQHALPLSNNVLITVLTAIVRAHTAVYRHAILNMIESGALYALTQAVQFS